MVARTENLNSVIKAYLTDVKQVFSVDKAYLYGSQANGTAHSDSDIDICIFSNSFAGKKSCDIIFELLVISRKYRGYDIEPRGFLVDDINTGNPFINEIIRTGIEIPL